MINVKHTVDNERKFTMENNPTPQPAVNKVYLPAPSPLELRLKDTSASTNMLLLGIISLAFGIFESRMIVHGGFGLGVTLVTLGFYICFAPFFLKRTHFFRPFALLLTLPLAALAISFGFNASSNGRFWMVVSLIGMCALHISLVSGCAGESPLDMHTVKDMLYTHTCAPFASCKTAVNSFFSGGRKNTSPITKIITGVLISIPVVIILFVSFSCADSVFGSSVEQFLDKIDLSDVPSIVGDIILGIILFFYFLPLGLYLRSGYRRPCAHREHTGKLDTIVCSTIIYISSAVYILFCAFQFRYLFAVQLSYYFNYSFDSAIPLPDDMTWAEYARSGFFELSAIIICTFIAAALIASLSKRDSNGKMPVHLRIALSVICACSIILVASAVLRMVLYTIWCGLTAKRIGVLFIIAFIAVSIILIIIKIWNEKLRVLPAMLACAVILISAYGCMNVDAVCARVNVYRHIELGTSIDIDYLGELSTAAAPSVERLMNESEDENVRLAARGIIAKYHYYGDNSVYAYDEIPFGALTYDDYRAEQIFERYRPSRDSVNFYTMYADYQSAKRDYERYHQKSYYSFDEFRMEFEDYYL